MENPKGILKKYLGKVIDQVNKHYLYPLSNSQRGMWIYYLKNPKSPAYNLSYSLLMEFDLDLDVLEKAIKHVYEQNPILGTAFVSEDGIPKQYIAKRAFPKMIFEDLTLQNINFAVWKSQKSGELASMPFDLTNDILFRLSMHKIKDNEYALFFVVHHIIFDGWSAGVFLKDLQQAYDDLIHKKAQKSKKKSNIFKAYCNESDNLFESGGMDDDFVYWFNRLFPAPKSLSLPYDFRRPQAEIRKAKVIERFIDKEQIDLINICAKTNRCTPFVFFLSAFFTTLWKITNSNRIMAGVSIANREREEFKDTIGPFSEVLPIVGEIDENQSFAWFLQKIKELVSKDFAHPRLMLDRLVQLIYPKGMPLGTDFFQVGFDYQNFPWPKSIGGVIFSEEAALASKIELNVSISSLKDGMQVYFEYASDQFSESTIESIADSYLCLLKDACSNYDRKLNELSFLPKEQIEIIKGWSKGPMIKSVDLLTSIHEIVLAHKTKIAVVMNDNSLTFEELWDLSLSLANSLIDLKVKEGDVVSFKLKPSIENIALIIAIWHVKAAYHPINNDTPEKILERYISIARPAVLIVNSDFNSLDKAYLNTKIISFDELINNNYKKHKLCMRAYGPAYLMFTSGSSGEPKAVMISHEHLSSYAFGAKHDFKIMPDDRVLQFAPLSFDASLEEILPTLLSGATLVIKDSSMMGSLQHFLKGIAIQNITILNIPSSYWHALIDEWSSIPTKVRMIITGGEPVSPVKLAKWLDLPESSNIKLINSYGVTEATVVTTRCYLSQFTKEECNSLIRVPIGSPFPNCEILVVDELKRPVPIGIFGEILILSHVPDNYFGAMHQSDKFCYIDGQKAFRTGDQGRFRKDGLLECKGRDDNQIKVDGFRIDIHEIELALMQTKIVREACVINVNDCDGSNRLIAHIETRNSQFDREELRKELRKYLAPYQIPHHFIELDRLPKSANGKIDRRQLLIDYEQNLKLNEPKVRKAIPQTILERVITSIWQFVLSATNVGLNDDFFAEGGSSLLAIRMLSLIENALGISIPLQSIFDDPTLTGLVEEAQKIKSNFNDKEIETFVYEKEYTYQIHPLEINRFNIKNHVAVVFCSSKDFDRKLFFLALTQIINNIHCLRTIYDPKSNSAKVIEIENDFFEQAFETCESEQLDFKIDQFINMPFNIQQDLPFRVKIFYPNQKKEHIALVFLEAAVDTKSIDLILSELCNMYALGSNGNLARNLKLVESNKSPYIQQRDYSLWLHKHYPMSQKNMAIFTQKPLFERYTISLKKSQVLNLEMLALNWMTSLELIFLNLWRLSIGHCQDSSITAVDTLFCQRLAPNMQGFRGAAGFYQQIPIPEIFSDMFFKDIVWAFQKEIFSKQEDPAIFFSNQTASFSFSDFFLKGLPIGNDSYLEPIHIDFCKMKRGFSMEVFWEADQNRLDIHSTKPLFLIVKNAIEVLSKARHENIKISDLFLNISSDDHAINEAGVLLQ